MQIKQLRLKCPYADVFITSSDNEFVSLASKLVLNKIKKSRKIHKLIGLSGGSTPFPVYEQLSKMTSEEKILEKCFWFQVDERLTSDRNRCNKDKIAKSMFKSCVGLLKDNFLAVDLNNNLDTVCDKYTKSFYALPIEVRPPEPVDLLIMGLGSDGHTASLFPECDWKSDCEGSDFCVFTPESQPEPRLSLKLDRIINAREILFLVNGKEKKEALEDIFTLNNFLKPAGNIANSRHTVWVINSIEGHDWINPKIIESESEMDI